MHTNCAIRVAKPTSTTPSIVFKTEVFRLFTYNYSYKIAVPHSEVTVYTSLTLLSRWHDAYGFYSRSRPLRYVYTDYSYLYSCHIKPYRTYSTNQKGSISHH